MAARLPENIEDAYPLAPLQSGMLFHSIASPKSGVYVEQLLLRLDASDLSVNSLKLAWTRLITRHPVLRTAFVWENTKQPLQVVYKTAELDWTELDYRNINYNKIEKAVAEYQKADRLNDFDLSKPALQRMTLIRVSDDLYTWIWTRHHIVFDGWSTSILLDELTQFYNAIKDERPLELPSVRPYRDYISTFKSVDSLANNDFWKRYLEGLETAPLLSEHIGKPEKKSDNKVASALHHEEIAVISEQDTKLLESTCRKSRVTLNTAVQAAWCILLERYINHSDITWGSVFSGRSENLKGAENIVGLLINTVLVRQQIDPALSVKEFLRTVQENLLNVMEHEQTALSEIQSLSPLGSEVSLFDTVVVFENYPRNHSKNNLFGSGEVEYHEQSSFPLALIVIPGKQLELILIYNSRSFSSSFSKRLLSEFANILVKIAKEQQTQVGQLDVLTNEELESLMRLSQRDTARCNNDQSHLRSEIKLVDTAISDQASEHPERIAIRFKDQSISYGELEALSNKYANRISEELTQRNTYTKQPVIALHLPRSGEAIVWMISVLKSGAAYLILDQSQPIETLQRLIQSSAASLLVTSDTQSNLNTDGRLPEINTGMINPVVVEEYKYSPNTEERDATDLAYILYTSGSTGKPKGVAISHHNLLASVRARFNWYTNIPENFLLLSPLSFDSSVAGIYWTLTAGGTLVVSPPRLEQNMLNLAESIDYYQITHTLCLPSLYRLLLESVERSDHLSYLYTLNTVIAAGEVIQPSGLLDRHQKMLPNTQLVNEYGPTEATVWCCAANMQNLPIDRAVPIGKPTGNNRLYVLDHKNRLAPRGAAGQLAIAGDQISPGYWQDQVLTAHSFRTLDISPSKSERVYLSGDQVCWREDDRLDFLGRNDNQVKIRGHRVELNEIELCLNMDSRVDDAAVVVLPNDGKSTSSQARLAAFVVVSPDLPDSFEPAFAIKEGLKSRLPQYMVPSVIEIRDELPKLSNNKIDRRNLIISPSEAGQKNLKRDAPETDQEWQLHKIWQELLGLEQIGVDDNFFELGGDSIMSIRLMSSLAKVGFTLNSNAVFETPTIRQLATQVQSARPQETQFAPALELSEQTALRDKFGNEAEYLSNLSESQSAYLFSWMRNNLKDPGHVQIQATVIGEFSDLQFNSALENIIEQHEALRTAIHWQERDSPVQVVYRKLEFEWGQTQVTSDNLHKIIEQYLVEDRENRLLLDIPQVWRLHIFRISKTNSILCWSFHHSLVDGWSAAIVIRSLIDEIGRILNIGNASQSDSDGSASAVQSRSDIVRYRDYLHWLNQKNLETEKSRWEDYTKLYGIETEGLSLPENLQESSTNSVVVDIKDTEWCLFRDAIKQRGTTVSRLVNACWGLVLSVVSENQRIAFSTTVSGRNIPIDGSEKIVGQLVNHLPVIFQSKDQPNLERTAVILNSSFALLSAIEHVSASQLALWSGGQGNISCCKINGYAIPSLVMVENFPWSDSDTESREGIKLSSFQRRGAASSFNESGSVSVFPITLVAVPEQDRLQLQLHYRKSLFEKNAATALLHEIYAMALHWSQKETTEVSQSFKSAASRFFSVLESRASIEQYQIYNGRPLHSEI